MSRLVPSLARVVAFVAFFVFLASAAHGAARPELRVWTDSDTVAAGEPFELHLQAMSTADMPAEPQPGAPASVRVSGPSIAQSHSFNFGNGVAVNKHGFTATWRVTAPRPGDVRLAPSVSVGGVRYATNGVIVHVVPPGQAPPRRQGGGAPNPIDPFHFDPMDPWKGLLGALGADDDALGGVEPAIPTDPKLALDAPRGRAAFLHATVDRTQAVVGEQVTYSVYLYVDVGEREPEFNDVHEATFGDFVKRPLLEDDNGRSVGNARVGGRFWVVKLVRRFALFPLKTGTLTIGPMRLAVAGPGGAASQRRESESIDVRVDEPPIDGRPPGYAVGDVGDFELKADVTPREAERGAAIAVNVELTGTGNLPDRIVPPTRQGVEWLVPEVREKLGNAGNDRFGGSRTFSFVVRVTRPGETDLGALTIPYWDPYARAYKTATAPLGTIHVSATGAPEVDAGDTAPLGGLPEARTSREAAAAGRSHLADLWFFWLALAAPPFAFIAASGGGALQRRVAAAVRARAHSPDALVRRRVDEAIAAAGGDDGRAIDAATIRAVEAAALHRAAVNVRGVPRKEAVALLETAGVDAKTAGEIGAILDDCEAARFAPAGVEAADARGRWDRARRCIDALPRRARKDAPRSPGAEPDKGDEA